MRTPNPELVAGTLTFLREFCAGREHASTCEQLRDYLAPAQAPRRIQEAIRELRRQGHPIASSSSAGYWFEPDPESYRKAMRKELIPRLRRISEDLRYTDRHLCDALNRALEGV